MGLGDILIILGCLAAGYWIVSSIMGPGIDVMRAGRDAEARAKEKEKEKEKEKDSAETSVPINRPALPGRVSTSGDPQAVPDWHIVLDIPRDASRRDIEAARKRRLATAENNGDTAAAERVQRAANWALRQAR